MDMRRLLTPLLLLCALLAQAQLKSQGDLLPVDEAFKLNASAVNNEIIFSWQIAKGYYLYKEKINISTNSDVSIGELIFPKAIIVQDEFFGRVGTYRDHLIVKAPIKEAKQQQLDFVIGYQGCSDNGVCYPPVKKNKQIQLEAISADNIVKQASNFMSSLGQNLLQNININQNKHPLPVKQAFPIYKDTDNNLIKLTWQISPDYYLYKDKFKFFIDDRPIKISMPTGKIKEDPLFGRVEVYENDVEFSIPTDAKSRQIKVDYQGCWSGGVCYPPQQYLANINQTSAVAKTQNNEFSEEQSLIQLLQNQHFLWVLMAFFGFGILLSLTPCIYPMIPILSGILVGQKGQIKRGRSFIISVLFVLSMALIYAIAGAIAGYTGANLQIWFQNPWILVSFSLVFVILAGSMFGLYDISLPKSWQNKLNQNQKKQGGYLSAIVLGTLSALIVGPCVAPPLAGALLYIGQTGDALLGGSALFIMSIGMGMPLLILGASAGVILPKAGAWMEKIKAVFGFLMLGVAIYLLERVLSEQVVLLLWASLCTLSVAALGVFKPLSAKSGALAGMAKAIGLLIFGYGILLFLLLARGGGDMFAPLASWTSNTQEVKATKKLVFNRVNNQVELQQLLTTASNNNKVAMLDFYADWCVSCKHMEKYVFTKPKVQAAFADIMLIKADVTDNTQDQKALMKAFSVVGPPALLFFKDNKELRSKRLIGEVGQKQILKSLSN